MHYSTHSFLALACLVNFSAGKNKLVIYEDEGEVTKFFCYAYHIKKGKDLIVAHHQVANDSSYRGPT